MDRSELEIIKELMAELESHMEPGKEDFEDRLGRGKPEVKVMKIEGKMPGDDESMEDPMEEKMESPEMEKAEDMAEMDHSMHHSMMGDDMMSPDEKLKARLMKMRA